MIRVDGIIYPAHRLAWLHVHGRWPLDQIDHKDHNRSNNAISNLREATQSQNQGNARAKSSNKYGIKGICFHQRKHHKRQKPWSAKITCQGVTMHLGYHHTAEMAGKAYEAASNKLFEEFACSAVLVGDSSELQKLCDPTREVVR